MCMNLHVWALTGILQCVALSVMECVRACALTIHLHQSCLMLHLRICQYFASTFPSFPFPCSSLPLSIEPAAHPFPPCLSLSLCMAHYLSLCLTHSLIVELMWPECWLANHYSMDEVVLWDGMAICLSFYEQRDHTVNSGRTEWDSLSVVFSFSPADIYRRQIVVSLITFTLTWITFLFWHGGECGKLCHFSSSPLVMEKWDIN